MRNLNTVVVATLLAVAAFAAPLWAGQAVDTPPEQPVVEQAPEPVAVEPEPVVVEQAPVVEPAADGQVEQAPEPVVAAEAAPEPVSLTSLVGALTGALDNSTATGATVSTRDEALQAARDALADAEAAHSDAMSAQGDADEAIRAAARALRDFIDAAFLTP